MIPPFERASQADVERIMWFLGNVPEFQPPHREPSEEQKRIGAAVDQATVEMLWMELRLKAREKAMEGVGA